MATEKPKAAWRSGLIGVVAGSGIMYSVKRMKAALVIGMSGTKNGLPEIFARIMPCRINPAIHAPTSGMRPVKKQWMMMPVVSTIPGSAQSHKPVMFSVK